MVWPAVTALMAARETWDFQAPESMRRWPMTTPIATPSSPTVERVDWLAMGEMAAGVELAGTVEVGALVLPAVVM